MLGTPKANATIRLGSENAKDITMGNQQRKAGYFIRNRSQTTRPPNPDMGWMV